MPKKRQTYSTGKRNAKGPELSEVQTENKPKEEISGREPWQNGNKVIRPPNIPIEVTLLP